MIGPTYCGHTHTEQFWIILLHMTVANYMPVVRQQIEVESELQSLQARLDDMTEKYSRAMAERDKAESAPLHDIRVRVQMAI